MCVWKTCPSCGIEKSIEDFYKRGSYCKECDRIRQRNRRKSRRKDDTEIRALLTEAIKKDHTFAISEKYTINVRSIFFQNTKAIEELGYNAIQSARKVREIAIANGFTRTGDGRYTKPDEFTMEDFK